MKALRFLLPSDNKMNIYKHFNTYVQNNLVERYKPTENNGLS